MEGFSIYPPEQLYVHTNKDIYESGEDLWFKVYHLDSYSFARFTKSLTLYGELLTKNDSVVWQEMYGVKEGDDSGVYLPR